MDNFLSLNLCCPYAMLYSSHDTGEDYHIMLSERINALFTLLGCNNTDIARYAGCSSGNISKLKTGNREPKPTSRSIASFVNGVYGYADYENMLPTLQELCRSPDTTRDALLPALISWLYEIDEIVLPAHASTPKSKRLLPLRRQTFGERLDRAVILLGLSNRQLSGILNIDVSLISRYRSGIYSPHGNNRLAEKLSDALVSRAEKIGKTPDLAALCGSEAEQLSADTVSSWLYDFTPEEDNAAIAQVLLHSLDEFTPHKSLPGTVPKVPETTDVTLYYGMEGLRSAVIRFLTDAAQENEELLLYSDEPMDWMTGDRAYFALWASLMAKCVSSGVRIKIIHNVERVGIEMINAIRGWLPLYISGRIEPFVFRSVRNNRFYHTVFLRSDGACIHGFFPAQGGDSRWYEYITDKKRLDLLEREYNSMLSDASPFLKVFSGADGEGYRSYCIEQQGTRTFLLSEFPVFTMPEELLTRILDRVQMAEPLKGTVLDLYKGMHSRFRDLLRQGAVNLILCPAGAGIEKSRRLNFALDLVNLSIDYTNDEYAQHISAVMDLVKNEKNFHLTLLPESPFQEIQIAMPGDAVSVLRCKEPYTAFVFLNSTLTKSVSDYLSELIGNYAADRHSTLEALDKLRHLSGR